VATQGTADVAVCGDFNVAPGDLDVYDPDGLRGKIHFHPDEHRVLSAVLSAGFVDVFRLCRGGDKQYSWWDYRAGAFRRNLGYRIDLVLATRALASRAVAADIDVEPRRGDKPSDHAPVVATFR